MATNQKGIKLINSIMIQRSLEVGFNFCLFLENELKWNPDGLLSLKALTPKPIGIGFQYLALWKGSLPMTCTYRRINRLMDWEVEFGGKGMVGVMRGQVERQGSGSLLTVTMTLIPLGFMHLLSPIFRINFQHDEVKNLANVKAYMESMIPKASMAVSQ